MSNLLVNPIQITAAMAGSFKASTLTSLGAFNYLLIEKVYWENPVSVGDIVNIEDPTSSMTQLNLRCEVSGQSQVVDWTSKPRRWSDFIVNVMASGTLWIYLA